jgi:hypothetical protein
VGVFDPERDEQPGRHQFAARIAVLFAVGLTTGLLVLPSVTGFDAGPDGTQKCVAVLDGWQARPDPNGEFTNDASVCVDEARHRLLLTGTGLVVIAAVIGSGVALARSRRVANAKRPLPVERPSR